MSEEVGEPDNGRSRHDSVVDEIGNTPLVRIDDPALKPGVEIYAKCEFCNPGGSVKDRPARRMILEGLRSGDLCEGKVILDSTSGNTGIAYAMIGAALGYPVKLAMPASVTKERKAILAAYGAEVVLTELGRRGRSRVPGCVERVAVGGEAHRVEVVAAQRADDLAGTIDGVEPLVGSEEHGVGRARGQDLVDMAQRRQGRLGRGRLVRGGAARQKRDHRGGCGESGELSCAGGQVRTRVRCH